MPRRDPEPVPSPVEQQLLERLAPFRFPNAEVEARPYAQDLRRMREDLPQLPADCAGTPPEALQAVLSTRGDTARTALSDYYRRQFEALAVEGLRDTHAYRVLFGHTALLDEVHRFAYAAALEETPAYVCLRRDEIQRELQVKQSSLKRRHDGLRAMEADLAKGPGPDDDPGYHAYLQQIANEQRQELLALETAVEALESAGPVLEAYANGEEEITRRLVLFARGGYGRAEMSFSSDVDTGYALDVEGLHPAQQELIHRIVLRMEELVHAAGFATAHQYFELGEDLSRFSVAETLHTIPSILESRVVEGSAAVLERLREEFRAVAPFERLVRGKVGEFDGQAVPDHTVMDLKEDFGGLRSIQVPLWLLGMTEPETGYLTADLLDCARRKGLLTPWEIARLLLALELLNDLRNFVGAAERFYYDREARESGFHIQTFTENRLDDSIVRLYLFRKQRFTSMDAFDSYRLRLLEDVQRISRRLLSQVLDRTVEERLGTYAVSVHLGRRCIIGITPPGRRSAAAGTEIAALFADGEALLTLCAYIATTGYDLVADIQEALTGSVTRLEVPSDQDGRTSDLTCQTSLLSRIMQAAFAHRAVRLLFAVSDPMAEGMPTLLGRWIPDLDAAVFLLRRFDGVTLPLHQQILDSLAAAESELALLRQQHPELAHLIKPHDVLALKWSLMLQALGRLPGADERPAQTAERAAQVLQRLGYDDAELERSVRLLIEHHATVSSLARTATYMDQAVAQYFEIAGRQLVHVVLLYLVNISLLKAQGDSAEPDVSSLRSLFDQTHEMLGVMRGFPVQERSLELINAYFDRKKTDLVTDTRLHLLLQDVIARGVQRAVLQPLEHSGSPAQEQVGKNAEQLDTLQREIVLGGLSPSEQTRREERLLQSLRHQLGKEAILELTSDFDGLLTWFFSSFANRYLMGSLPGELSAQMAKFAQFREAKVIVDVVPGPRGGSGGLLIYIRDLDRPHTRVAYTLSRNRIDVGSGKVNRVELGGRDHAYCYYFQIAALGSDEPLVARDLELMIAGESPPELSFPDASLQYERPGVRVEYEGDDGKGYVVVPDNGGFRREEAALPHLKVVMRDEPYLFYRVARAFDLYEVEIRQALITTIGNQVVDYFYLDPDDYQQLKASNFEEVLFNLLRSDLLSVVR